MNPIRVIQSPRGTASTSRAIAAACALFVGTTPGKGQSSIEEVRTELAVLRETVAAQQAQIERLTAMLEHNGTPIATAPVATAPEPARSAPPPSPPTGGIRTKKGFGLELYGYVKLDASYDTQQTYKGNVAFYVLPENGDGPDDEFNLTAKQSRLGINLTSDRDGDFNPGGKFEIDFYGSSSETAANPRIRQAYLDFDLGDWNVLGGQTWDAIQSFLPKTVNFAALGKQGAVWTRRPQIRLTRRLETGHGTWTLVGAAARTVGSDLDGQGQEDGKDFPVPTLQGRVAYDFPMNGGKALVALAGQFGTETLDTSERNDVTEYQSHLATLSLQLPLTESLRLQGALWTGQNLSQVNGGIGQGINVSKGTEIAATGGWIQLEYAVDPKLDLYATFGIDDPDNADLNPGMRSRNRVLSTSLWWKFSPHIQAALEYTHMETDYLDAPAATNHRIQSSLILGF